MTEENKTCKFKIYVDRPTFMIDGEVLNGRQRRNRTPGEGRGVAATSISSQRVNRPKKNISPEALDSDGSKSMTGHVFIGLVDENGVEQTLGFHAKSFWYGAENVEPENRINSLSQDAFKKVAGFIQPEKGSPYDDVIEYNISREQYDKTMKFVKEFDKPYVLLLNNCTVFAHQAAKAAGVRPPPALTGLHTPHGLSISVRAIKKLREVKETISKASQKIAKFFGLNKDNPAKTSEKTTAKENQKTISSDISPLIGKRISASR